MNKMKTELHTWVDSLPDYKQRIVLAFLLGKYIGENEKCIATLEEMIKWVREILDIENNSPLGNIDKIKAYTFVERELEQQLKEVRGK